MLSLSSAAARPVSQPPLVPQSPAPGLRWLLPLAALVVLGGLGWGFLVNRGPVMPAASPIIYNNVDVGAKATQLYEGLKSTVAGIKDASSATASLPKLQAADVQLGDMREMAAKMPDATRNSFSGLFAKLAPGLEGLVESAIKAAGPDSARPRIALQHAMSDKRPGAKSGAGETRRATRWC